MESSRARFKVASIPDERVESIRRKVKDEEERTFAIMAEQIIAPAGMTPEKVRAIRDAVGTATSLRPSPPRAWLLSRASA
ncbi:MAG: hypothetical protein IPI16_16670 [Comamonadaceae bacterium]|nr:hypothetical protein [Comamonadaceae bacterium]